MEFNGKVYELVPQHDDFGCGGCAFDNEEGGCSAAGNKCLPSYNEGRLVVWAEVQHGD